MIARGPFDESIQRFLKPIQHLMEDAAVSEIMINGPEEIWVEKKGILSRTVDSFPCSQALYGALNNISQYAGRPLNSEHPILEAFLPDGSRLEAVLPPVAKDGPAVSIRRFFPQALTISQLVEFDCISAKAAVFLSRAMNARQNIIVSGGTGSGKTSLLCALSAFFRDRERIVVLEDTHELNIQKDHTVYLETRSADDKGRGRVNMRDLLKASLRLRPDRIVLGEIRGEEALDLLQAMTSGHGGSMSTLHATTPVDALQRLETMALSADEGLPHLAIRAQIASAVHLVVQIERTNTGKRMVTQIARVRNQLKNNSYVLEEIFTRKNGSLPGPLNKKKRAR